MVQVKNVLLIHLLLLGIFNHDEVSCLTQQELNYIASNLEVYYEVVDNLASHKIFTSRLTLTNKGEKEITKGSWAIYFNFIRLIEPDYLKDNPSGYVIPDIGLKFVHVTGSLFKLEPVQGFQSLASSQSLSFKFDAQHHSVAKTDAMPNWYVSADGLDAVNLERTTGEELSFVGKFDTAKKWKRGEDDQYNPFTPTNRWERIKIKPEKPVLGSFIPTPVELHAKDEQYVDIHDWEIVTSTKFENEAKYLVQKLNLSVKNYTGKRGKIIHLLHKDVDVKIEGRSSASEERYTVEVEENMINISAPYPGGCFYGITSLLAITDIEKKQVLKASIKDAPRFKYRGLMLDISRNFHGKSSILKVLKTMAEYKMNKLHLHLSDDEGWRLEIPGLEELTKFGGARCFDTKKCLAPQIGSGAKTSTSGSGYLTVTDYKKILQLSKTLHIEIIPEFDMPGHSHAAIKAMEYRFLNYNASRNETIRKDASKFLLAEPDDPSKYFSVQMFRDNAVNPCLNSTYDFIEHVLSALVRIHENVSPLKLFHMGGDEVANGAWVNSTACQSLTIPKEIDSLKKYFTSRLSAIAAKYNISFAAWEDGFIENGTLFNKTRLSQNSVYGYAWDNVWEWGAFDRAYRLANAGYKTILGHATHLYFDMPYEPDPEERGYYWATRFTDTMKTFGYMPDSVYDNAEEDRMGNPLNKEKVCTEKSKCPPLVRKDNILGIQGNLWSETVRTEDQLFYMCFPRVLALAERAWHKAEFEKDENSRSKMLHKEWGKFANLLGYRELRKLDEMGVKYRVPLPGAKLESDRWLLSSAFPGLKIEYKTETEWKEYNSSVPRLSGSVKFRTKSADGKRSSREIKLDFSFSYGSKVVSPGAFVQFVILVSILFFT